MCNLYDIGPGGHRNSTKWEQLVFEVVKDIEKKVGIRKTDPGLILLEKDGEIVPKKMRWGFVRHFNPAINNARSDKLDGMWKGAWEARHRCLIPISTFYEWSGPKGNKQTHAFQAPGEEGRLLWAAGLWEKNADAEIGNCFSMMTTDASEQVEAIHHRMPVLLGDSDFEDYLEQDDPKELLTPFAETLTIFNCVNPLKKSTKHEGPVADQGEPLLPGFE